QVILSYTTQHNMKSGTPTMGGIIFIITISLSALLFFTPEFKLAGMALLLFIGFGLIGFLDDFIKFKFKRNLGLRPYQKIIAQFLLALAGALYVYFSPLVGSLVWVPFADMYVDFGFWIIPLITLIFLATTNSVNLTDGLDGLASSTTMCYMISFIALLMMAVANGTMEGESIILMNEHRSIIILASAVVGALLCFLTFNSYPAKIFMGDTGSLALGSLVASVAVFTRSVLFIPIFGIMFVVSAVSVIVQVAYYKRTKRRVFLMAPLHHHFEKKGIHEVKIAVIYSIITMMVGVVVVLLEMM
ncbi:MAG: phospho-N-acetylmuramoyl-pentapeptide-transferase, partial [Clostridia bacterium]